MRGERGRGSWLLVLAAVCAASTVVFALAAWLIFRDRPGWSTADVAQAVAIAAGVGAALGALFGQPLFGQWLSERRTGFSPSLAPALTGEQRHAWLTVLRDAVVSRRVRGESSQLAQMVRQGTVVDARIKDVTGDLEGSDGRSRVRIAGRTADWPEIVVHWEREPRRMVILGEPGYGKTVAALSLLTHLNQPQRPERVAELFPLAEWHSWHQRRSDASFVDWLVHHLATTYGLPPEVALDIVQSGSLVALLDGFDEVPPIARERCRELIESYAGRSGPFLPFVVTSRLREYGALEAEWISADRHVALVGLSVEQMVEVISARTSGRHGWQAVRSRLVDGDQSLETLFRSPLRLSTALQAYRHRDPRELIGLSVAEAQSRCWDLLFETGEVGFRGATGAQVKSWLAYLAAGMERAGRQRFWLHELHLYGSRGTQWRFRLQVGAVYTGGLLLTAMATGFSTVTSGVLAAACGFMAVTLGDVEPRLTVGVRATTAVRAMWRNRASVAGWIVGVGGWGSVTAAGGALIAPHVPFAVPAVVGIASGALVAILLGTQDANLTVGRSLSEGFLFMVSGASCALFGGAAGEALGVWGTAGVTAVGYGLLGAAISVDYGSTAVVTDPPLRLRGRGPRAVLDATRNEAVRSSVVSAVAACAIFGPLTVEPDGRIAVIITTGSLVGLTMAVAFLQPWLYYYWLRWWHARRGHLPWRLPAFLDWCASQDRAWLRVSDAYEFRHRELLSHLARSRPPTGGTPAPDSADAPP